MAADSVADFVAERGERLGLRHDRYIERVRSGAGHAAPRPYPAAPLTSRAHQA